MKVNRMIFDKIKVQWEILKIASAITKHDQDTFPTDYEDYEFDTIEETKPKMSYRPSYYGPPLSKEEKVKKDLISQMKLMEDLGNSFIEEENYREVAECKKVWLSLKNKLNKL